MSDSQPSNFHPGTPGSDIGVEPLRFALLQEMISRLALQPKDRILDAGCGEGWAGRLLAALVPQGTVVGLDFSADMIHAAREKSAAVQNLMFVWGDAAAVPWQENYFSTVLCIDSFDLFENQEKALGEIFRVMSPGGSLWIVNLLPNEEALSARQTPDSNVLPVPLGAEQYKNLFEHCGFLEYRYEMISLQSPAPESEHRERNLPVTALLMNARKPQA